MLVKNAQRESLLEKQGKDIKKFLEVAEKLVKKEVLEAKFRNHKLKGNFKGR